MVWILALSVQDQVERYGAYVGIAAFIGLALLSLLTVAQARELRRLRDWAGRAPERARELEQRVAASADVARRPDAPAAAPEPVGAAAAAAPARSGTVGRAVPIGTPAPPAPDAPATDDPDATLVPEPSRVNGANGVPPVTAAGAAGPAQPPAAAPPEGPEPASAAAPPGAVPADGAPPAPPAPAGTDDQATQEAAALPGEGGEIAARRLGARAPEDEDGAAKGPADDGDAPTAPSAAPVPAAAAAPLRAAQPTAAVPGRRFTPSGGAPRRPIPPPVLPPEDHEEPGRPLWLVLLGSFLAVVVLAAGAFAATRALTGEDEPAAPPVAAETPAPGPGGRSGSASRRVTTAVRGRTTVAVLNGTTISGLAARTRDTIVDLGYREGAVADAEDTGRSASIVYFAAGARPQADEIRRRLQISDVRALDPGVAAIASASGPQADVVVVVGSDQSSGAPGPGGAPAEPTATPTSP